MSDKPRDFYPLWRYKPEIGQTFDLGGWGRVTLLWVSDDGLRVVAKLKGHTFRIGVGTFAYCPTRWFALEVGDYTYPAGYRNPASTVSVFYVAGYLEGRTNLEEVKRLFTEVPK